MYWALSKNTNSHPCTSPSLGGHEGSWGAPVVKKGSNKCRKLQDASIVGCPYCTKCNAFPKQFPKIPAMPGEIET